MPKAKAQSAAGTVAEVVSELLNQSRAKRGPKELSVGVRNVSSEVVSLPAFGNEPVVVLNPTPATGEDPNAYAVISYAQWMGVRKHPIMGLGMIMRDDSILGEIDSVGPKDKPTDLHPDHTKNCIADPDQWILDRDEAALRSDIGAITSETTLRHLEMAVSRRIGELERGVPRAERLGENSPGIKQALSTLPMRYKLADELVQHRMDDIRTVIGGESRPQNAVIYVGGKPRVG